jgi:hypothetical protein
MARRPPAAELKSRRRLKHAAQVSLALVAAGLLALIYVRTL